MLHVLYFVHDLSDPAVRRRVIILQAGGASVTLAGFRRGKPVAAFEGVVPVELGVTSDGRFAQRLGAVAKAAFSLGDKLRSAPRPDVIIGRNLEMLALANRAKAVFGGDIPIVYECLDIHRLMLRSDPIGKAMRAVERTLGRKASLLLTSSPAFIREYFEPYGQIDAPIVLVENKVLELDASRQAPLQQPASGEPWKIGWFGALRCPKSLALLAEFTRSMEGRYEVVLRGRPAYREFPEFDNLVADEPFMSFEGSYKNPEDLPDIYAGVHFSWAIDFFEEGLNSSWLLPNRLYEGCRYGVVPIAMQGTETGRFIAQRRLGLLLNEASSASLAATVAHINAETYALERRKVAAQEKSVWVTDRADCRALVERLGALIAAPQSNPILQAA
jgi:succinoglycan biosynthesis protein ExoL